MAEGTSKSNSDVWKYYKKIKGAPMAKCTICKQDFSYRGRTTNLRLHLQVKHSIIYAPKKSKNNEKTSEEPCTSKQMSLDIFSKQQYCSEARASTITERIVNMIAIDRKPTRMVEGEGFLKLMDYLEPDYKVPSRKFITGVIHKKHEATKEKLQDKLETEASSIALTTDICTSSATEAYITASAYYISTEWKMISCVSETPDMPERHTRQNIADKLMEIADSWDISEKISVIVHNQASNMESSSDILESKRGWQGMKCSGHCLQLCVNAGLSINTIECLTGAARKLVSHFKRSVVASEELKKGKNKWNN